MPKAGETHDSRIKKLEKAVEELQNRGTEPVLSQDSESEEPSQIEKEVQLLNKAVSGLIDQVAEYKAEFVEHKSELDAHNVAILPRHGTKKVGT